MALHGCYRMNVLALYPTWYSCSCSYMQIILFHFRSKFLWERIWLDSLESVIHFAVNKLWLRLGINQIMWYIRLLELRGEEMVIFSTCTGLSHCSRCCQCPIHISLTLTFQFPDFQLLMSAFLCLRYYLSSDIFPLPAPQIAGSKCWE